MRLQLHKGVGQRAFLQLCSSLLLASRVSLKTTSTSFVMGCASSHSTDESAAQQELNESLRNAFEKYGELLDEIENMMLYRKNTVAQMNSVAEELDRQHRNVTITKLLIAAGSVLAPFTAGTSGGLIAVGGTIVLVLTSLYEKRQERIQLDEVVKAVNKDKEQCEKVAKMWKEFEDNCSRIFQAIETVEDHRMRSMKNMILGVARKNQSNKVCMIAEVLHEKHREGAWVEASNMANTFSILLTKSKGIVENNDLKSMISHVKKYTSDPDLKKYIPDFDVTKFTAEAAVFMIYSLQLVNFIVLIENSIKLYNGSPSKLGEEIRKLSSELENQHKEWDKAFGSYVSTTHQKMIHSPAQSATKSSTRHHLSPTRTAPPPPSNASSRASNSTRKSTTSSSKRSSHGRAAPTTSSGASRRPITKKAQPNILYT